MTNWRSACNHAIAFDQLSSIKQERNGWGLNWKTFAQCEINIYRKKYTNLGYE